MRGLNFTLLLFFFCFKFFQSAGQQTIVCPPNIDFEQGNFANWRLYTGSCCPIAANTLSGAVANRHVITSGNGTDPFGGFPVVAPGAGVYSLKLGNSNVNKQAERARYYVPVPAGVNNYSIIFRYAVVFEDPGHNTADQPRFEVKAYDSATNTILPCSQFTFVASSNIPGFQLAGSTTTSTIWYKSWTTASIDLSGYAGKTVAVDFATGDCDLGAHFGYGYVDLNCGLLPTNTVVCSTSPTFTLSAPAGFAHYEWRDSSLTTLLDTNQTATLTTPATSRKYAVILTPYTGFGCPDTIYTQVTISSTTVNITNNDTTICNGTTLQLNTTATASTGPVTYSWTPAIGLSCTNCANPVVTLPVNTKYFVTATNGNGCPRTDSVRISSSNIALALTKQPVTCFGLSNGTMTATPTGGKTPYSYSWNTSPVQTTAMATGLAAGVYTVTVTDSLGCTRSAADTVKQPIVLAATATKTDVSCFGGGNGTATVTATGGTGAYTYSWNTIPIKTTATATGLSAGSYTVTVTDGNNCTATATVTIGQPTQLTAATAKTDASCNGGTNGTATVTAVGGTGPYTYSWNTTPVQTTAIATGLAAGTYLVTVTDAHSCVTTATATIGHPTALTASTTKTDVSCNGGTNGTATVTASGGTGVYTYSWSTMPVKITPVVTGLAAGTYTVTVTDANNCTATTTATIGQPTLLTATTTRTDVSCNGGSNGTATVNAGGGTAPYTYSWSTIPAQTAATATGLVAGTYTVTVTDDNGCVKTATAIVAQPTALTATASKTDVSCYAGNNGTATVTANSGTAPYTYSWNTSPVQTTTTATGLMAGTYTATVTDNNGCAATATTTIGQPAQLAATTTKTDASCNGGTNGTATVTATGGTAPYTYSWNTAPVKTTATATGLAAGTYTVTVTDAHNCIVTATATIWQPSALVATTAQTDVSCNGGANGTATVTATGGTGTYTYNWNTTPVQTTPVATGLAAGTYTVLVTDANSCTTTATATVGQPAILAASTTKSDVSCNGGNNGSATATATGGIAPYTYSWSTVPAQTTVTASGLAAGSYTVTVTDNNGCVTTANVVITQPTPLSAIATKTDATCFSGNNGTATAIPSGGTAPYTYSWNTAPVQTTVTATGLANGSYTVTITDANGCVTTASVTVGQPNQLNASAVKTDVSCFGGANGTATVTATGGLTPYSYSWNTIPVQTSTTATGLTAGNYTVTVTDDQNCVTNVTVTVTQPAQLSASISKTDVGCNGGSNGTATVTGTGGTAPYTYIWNTAPVQTTALATGLSAGSYSVIVTDSKGCVTNASATIGQSALLTSTLSKTDVSCHSGSNGIATVVTQGGTAPYTYSWNTLPVKTTATAPGLMAGTYTVTVTDANGCTRKDSITVGQPSFLLVSTTKTDVSCFGGANGTATATTSGGVSPYTYSWNTSPVQTGITATGLANGGYSVVVTDANGCTASIFTTITQPAQLTASTTKTDALCNGKKDGAAAVVAAGGTVPYTYSWNTVPVQVTGNAVNLASGAYTVTVTDGKGCVATANAIVGQPSPLVHTIGKTDVSCYGDHNGTATINMTGGTAPYNYIWLTSPVQSTATATGLSAGVYKVAVKDAHSCPDTATVTIAQPPALNATTTKNDVKCYGDSTGAVTVTATGGTSPYTYSWSTSPAQTGNTATSLPIGKYSVMVTDAKGCKITAVSDSIAQPPPLLVNANGDQTCYGQANGSATAVASGGTAPYAYSWYILPVQSGATANQLYAGSYTVLATDANGCQNTAAAIVAELPSPEVVATGAATICQGGRVPLSVTGAKSYIWSPATSLSCDNCNKPIAAPANTITYIVVGIDSNNCSDTEKLTVTVIPRVPVSVGPDIDVCIGDPVQLQAHGGVAYIWSPEAGLNNPSVSNPVSGTDTSITYKVVITENECFKDTLYQRVRVHKRPTVELGPDKKGIPGATIQLHADTTNTISIAWKPADHLSCDDCYDPVATLYKTITYKATVSSGVCEASDEIRIVVGCDDELFFIPNTFTPNGDGNNDRFWPIAEGVNQIDRFAIYDRWGEPVFTANRFPPNDPTYGWDGTYKGAELKPDVYVYYLESRCGNGEKIFLKGDISLIR